MPLYNITERKLVEIRLQEEQRKFSTLISNLPGMVYRCKNDPNWSLEFSSENIQELSGYPLEDFFSGRIHWVQIILPDDRQRVWDKVQDAVEVYQPFELEYRIIHADGSVKWVWEHGCGVFDKKDQLEALEGVVFDITDRKIIEQSLKDSEEKFFKAFHSSPHSMVINRLGDGRLIDVNRTFEKIVGYSRDEAIGKTPIELSIWVQPEERDRYTQILKEQESVRDFEVQVRRKDGEIRTHKLSAETIELDGEPCIVSIGEDITDSKQAGELLTVEKNVLALIATGQDLEQILDVINTGIERLLPGSLCSILLLDDKHKRLRYGSAPGLPCEYNEAIDGIYIGPNAGSCGTAAYFNKQIIVNDIAADPLWADYRDLAARHNLKACWSTPVHSSSGRVLGSFAIYYRWPATPASRDKELINRMSHLAGIAIEKNMTNRALIRSEAKYRSIVETTGEWIWECDLEVNIIYSNKAIENILGYRVGEFISQDTFSLIHAEDRDYVREKLCKCIKNRTGWNGWVIRWRHKNGEYRYLESNAKPVFDTNGELIGFRGTDRDITARKNAEEEINELKRQNELILEHAGEGIYGLDVYGRTTFVNPAAAKMLGWQPDELIGQPQHELIHYKKADGSTYPEEECPIYATLKDGDTHRVENEYFFRKDGSRFPVEYTSTPIRNASGKLEGAVVIFRDISDRKRSEMALRRSEAMLSEAQQVAHMGSWEVDHELRQLTWSDEVYRIFEVNKDTFEVSYESFLEAVHPDDRDEVDAAFREAVKKQSTYNINHRLLFPDGRIKYINEKCKTYYDEHGKPLRSVGTTIDYTKEKMAEMELEAKARQQQFIAKLGRLSLAQSDLADIFDIAITGLAEILDVEFSKILELQPDAKQFVVVAGHGWGDGMIGHASVNAGLGSLADYTLNQNKPVVVEDLQTELRFNGPQLLFDYGIVSGISVIIEGRDKPYGVLGILSKKQRQFTPYDVDFVQAVGVILAEAIEHEFVAEQILSSRQRLRNLAARLQAVREEERTRISREIHDELGQTLTGLRIDLAWIYNQLQEEEELSEKVHSALELADSTLVSIRRISHDLRPPILDDLGLEAAVEWQVEEFRRYSHCQCDLEINVGDIGIQSERDTIIFRILQEALTNIARHANTDKVEVKLSKLHRRLILKVSDNGIGINRNAIDSNDSIGLIGMRERAGIFGGRVDIQRGDKGGTVVNLVIPLTKGGNYNS